MPSAIIRFSCTPKVLEKLQRHYLIYISLMRIELFALCVESIPNMVQLVKQQDEDRHQM